MKASDRAGFQAAGISATLPDSSLVIQSQAGTCFPGEVGTKREDHWYSGRGCFQGSPRPCLHSEGQLCPPSSGQVGAGQLEQEPQEHSSHCPWYLGPARPHPGHLGACSCGAADIQARVCGLRVQSDLTHTLPGWSIVHTACFLGLYFWRTDVTSLPKNLLLIKVRWPGYSAVPGTS